MFLHFYFILLNNQNQSYYERISLYYIQPISIILYQTGENSPSYHIYLKLNQCFYFYLDGSFRIRNQMFDSFLLQDQRYNNSGFMTLEIYQKRAFFFKRKISLFIQKNEYNSLVVPRKNFILEKTYSTS